MSWITNKIKNQGLTPSINFQYGESRVSVVLVVAVLLTFWVMY